MIYTAILIWFEFLYYTLFIQRSKAEEMQNLRLRVATTWKSSFHSFWTPWPRPLWQSVGNLSSCVPLFWRWVFPGPLCLLNAMLDWQWAVTDCCRGALLRAPCNDPSSRSHLSCDKGWGTGLNKNTGFLYYCRVWVSDILWYQNRDGIKSYLNPQSHSNPFSHLFWPVFLYLRTVSLLHEIALQTIYQQ